jgi:Fe-S-cluster containining protein
MTEYRNIGPVEKQLRTLWNDAKNRIYYPKNWLKLQKLRRCFDLNFILYKDIKIMVPTGKVPDCDTCLEICCTGPKSIVSLRLRDIAALIDVGLQQHITHEKKPLAVFGNNSVFETIFPVLTQDRTRTCTLLDENRMCRAYPYWPISCARYPYAIDVVNKVVFYAKGCGSYDLRPPYEVAERTRYLVQAAIESYNERIKDIFLIYFAQPELEKMGLSQYLNTFADILHKNKKSH